MQRPLGVQFSDVDAIVTIVLPQIEGKRLVRLMGPYLLIATIAVAMFAFGVWHFGSHWTEVQSEAPLLAPMFLAFMALLFFLAIGTAAAFCLADRRVTIQANGEELIVVSEGSLGQRRFRCPRDAITAMYADAFWVWIYGPKRPKHILWQRLPEERFWVAGTLATFLGVGKTVPLAANEIEVRAIILDDDQIRRPPCPDGEWILDANEWNANLRIERHGAVLRLFQHYPTKIRFHRLLGLKPGEWLIWLRRVFRSSFEVLPQDAQWVQQKDRRCLRVSFRAVVGERPERLTLILWHGEARRLEPLYELLTQASPVDK